MSGTQALPYDLLDERYRLESLLGRGGMAAVYRAVDTRLDRPVAVKILGDAPAADDRRFRSEVRTLARFSHPNLVRVLDAGEIDDRLYLVMDLIDGPTLAEHLREGALHRHEVARIGSGIASALAYVHGEGIVHRDVKPGNILLGGAGVAYLADFGISRLLDTTGMTTTGQLVGTPAYLAPEQLHGADVGPAADVYALGLVLLECLRGERAFTGTLSEIAASRMLQGPKIPATLEPRWGALITAMTETDAQRRVTVAEVAGTLGRWSHESGHPLPLQARPPLHPDPDHGSTAATRIEVPSDARTRRQTGPGPAAPTRRQRADGRRGVDRPGAGGTAPGGRGESSRRQLASVLIAGAIALLVGLALGAALLGPGSTRGSALSSKRGLSSAHTGTTPPPRTSTVRVTVTRRTTPPVSTLPAAAGEFVSRLAAGEASGDVSPQAGQQLLAQLQPLALTQQAGAAQQIQQFDQLAQVFDLEVASGQITGTTTVTSLKDAIGTLASVLGTSVPAPTNASQAVPGNDFKPGHGHGNGHGDGFGGG